ncbi:methyl-accepting chemotaxis protein [Rhizobacter sp. J219]|uniref:methyl-accepting chemotaxis protein n=1 Tax=Rhizobacter sp. J219 TaxID=2898430 RepID=UPI0027E2DD2D|nr:methyl-accepting chemotaxis protein [Rhizobacter sp. J219]
MNLNHLIRSFTIRTRMLGAVFVVAASLLLVGAVGFGGQTYSNSVSMSFFSVEFSALQRIGALRTSMHQLRLHEKDMLIQYESPDKFGKARDAWMKTFEEVDALGETLAEALPDPAQAEQAKKAMAQLATFKTRFQPVMKQLEAQSFDTGRAALVVIARTSADFNAAQATVDALAQEINASATVGQERLQRSGRMVTFLLLGTIGVLLVMILPLTLANMHSICKPLDQAEALAKAIAQGDLTDHHVDTHGKDEAARLLQALSGMQRSLRDTIRQVRTSTDSINTASAEIASGNSDLSSRTEQAASNLQQTASSMEQLTGTVKQSADSARQANQFAASAAEVAQRGGSVVAQVVSTMDEINASSKKISDIIGVIDGIAFQTNILALNAAVEAARAGEQGRGFAVVASEVRSLAQRSAEAAREIKGLIGTSVDKVEAGSRLVADAGATMTEIVGSVQRVTDIIGEITAASSEQSDGIGQVNSAVAQLDQMTQQNAALVEQSAAAADSLQQQAGNLSKVVGTFRLEATS